MDKIKAKPEGRKGIFLVTAQDMVDWLAGYPDEDIHNFRPGGGVIMGADWSKSDVIDLLESAERIAILTGTELKHNLNHALAVIAGNELYMFNIGTITESDIELGARH